MADPRTKMPVIFLSHGAPTLPLTDSPARTFLIGLSQKIPRPRAILIASAHWEGAVPSLTGAELPETIHDFYGFDPALYDLRYDAPGDPSLAQRISSLLEKSGYRPAVDSKRGRDHGAWVPMMLAYPAADIPIIQISLLARQSAHIHLAMGEALAPLREEGVLIVGSGGAIHNLRQLQWKGGAIPPWASDFQEWLDQQILAGNLDGLLGYRTMIDSAVTAHPTDEHFMPLFVALGAAKEDRAGIKLHGSFEFGSLSMASYGWGMGR